MELFKTLVLVVSQGTNMSVHWWYVNYLLENLFDKFHKNLGNQAARYSNEVKI